MFMDVSIRTSIKLVSGKSSLPYEAGIATNSIIEIITLTSETSDKYKHVALLVRKLYNKNAIKTTIKTAIKIAIKIGTMLWTSYDESYDRISNQYPFSSLVKPSIIKKDKRR